METLVNALSSAAQLEAELTQGTVPATIKENLTAWGAGIFRLVVMGEIKKGKSSFINAMLGVKDLVPVSSNVATSTIFKIRYGKNVGYKVYFLNESEKEPLSIGASDLHRFGTEDGNPNNREQVYFIEVTCPSPLLKSGIVIIDTPGLGGLFKAHKQITYQYVPRADAVFFVTDSVESPIGQLETEYLEDIKKITSHLYFVQTKSFSVDKEAREARRNNNLDILSQCLGVSRKEIPYFMVDSSLRFAAEEEKDLEDLQESGYPQLLAYIRNELQANQKKILAGKAVKMCSPIITHLEDIINFRKKNLEADTEEKRNQQEKENAALQKDLSEWQDSKQPELLREIQAGLQKIRLNATESCNQCRPSGEIQCRFEDSIREAKNMDELKERIASINQNLPGCVEKVIQQTSRQIQCEAQKLLNNLAGSASEKNLSVAITTPTRSISTKSLENIKFDDADIFQIAKTSVWGGLIGTKIATVVGGIIGSVVPGIGTIIGSTVGMALAGYWGVKSALNIQAQQELKSAKMQVCSALSQTMSSAYTKIQNSIERFLANINMETSNAVQHYIQARKKELSQQMEEIKTRSRMNNAELGKKKNEIVVLGQKMALIKKNIASYFPKQATM